MINKNKDVVYLENVGRLIRFDVSYDKAKIMSYINNKKGAKWEEKNIFSCPFCVFNDKNVIFYNISEGESYERYIRRC